MPDLNIGHSFVFLEEMGMADEKRLLEAVLVNGATKAAVIPQT